jgi:hypothetical protein
MESKLMETESQKTPILNIAWIRHASLSASASKRTKAFFGIRKWIIWLGVLATLLALMTKLFFSDEKTLIGLIVKILLVSTPVLASVLAAFSTRFYSNGAWLIQRGASEEIKKEIYIYRTILQNSPKRRIYLEKKLAEIQRKLFRNLAADLSFDEYDGPIPPGGSSNDPGFNDLTGDEYFAYRLEDQWKWHNNKMVKYKKERRRLTIFVLTAGGLGAVFAAWGGGLSIWVALTASITAALLGWQELRNLDATIKNYSKVVIELTLLYDHWQNLEPEERTTREFYRMVRACEDVIWAQNVEYVKSMQEALAESGVDEEAGLINRAIKDATDSVERTKQAITESIVEQNQEALQVAEEKIVETVDDVLGSLAEEASSELVQQELDAMGRAIVNIKEEVVDEVSSFSTRLQDIAKHYAKIDISRHTKKEELNTILASYPKTGEIKG